LKKKIRLWEEWAEGIQNFIDISTRQDDLIIYHPEEFEIGEFNYDQFSKLNSVKIATGLFRDDYHKRGTENTELYFIDRYFVLHVLWEFQYGSYKYPKKPATHLFCILNGRASWQRAMFMDKLAERKLLKHNIWTWNQKYTSTQYVPRFWKPQEKRLEVVMEPRHPPKESFICAFNVGTETNPDVSFVTEKTYRPMLYRQMPLLLGPPGMFDYLNKIGFMLSPIVDYSFDNKQNLETRASALADELKRLSKKYTPQEIRIANRSAVEHNFNKILDIGLEYYPDILLEHDYYKQQKLEIAERIKYLDQYRSLT